MDRLDRKILRLLQENSTLAVADIAKKVGLSTTPCWRRIQKLEEEGVIRKRVALLDPAKINVKGSSLAYGHPFAATGARIPGRNAQKTTISVTTLPITPISAGFSRAGHARRQHDDFFARIRTRTRSHRGA